MLRPHPDPSDLILNEWIGVFVFYNFFPAYEDYVQITSTSRLEYNFYLIF